MKPVLMIFVDGFGLGPPDPRTNPLAAFEPRALRCFEGAAPPLPFEGTCLPTDATLGVEGLPQSATGQTALFTGTNAARLLDCHVSGFPTRRLRDVVARESLMKRLKRAGLRVSFANTYTDRYFTHPPRWKSVTTVMCESADVRLWRVAEMDEHDSLFMDFTNRLLRERGHDAAVQSPADAGRRLARHALRHDFCLYEYFLTDLVAHRGSFQQAVEVLRELDEMVAAVLASLDLERHSVLLVSDHGNIEDATTKLHTRRPVPTLVWGPLRRKLPAVECWSLTDITPWILQEQSPMPLAQHSGG